MTTYPLPVSEGLAARLASLPPDRVNAVNSELVELLADLLDENNPSDSPAYPLTDEDIASIRQGLEDSDAGRVTDGPTFFAEFDQSCDALRDGK